MDRRTFLKAMGAAFAVSPFNISGPVAAVDFQQGPPSVAFPKIRFIAIGLDGRKMQQWKSNIGADSRLIDGELYVDALGHIAQRPADPPIFFNETAWQRCCADLAVLDFKKAQFKAAKIQVADFIRGADWLFMAVMLDNAMAFAICDEIALIAKAVGVPTMAYVGAPCANRGHPGADAVSSDRLKEHSREAIGRMLDACAFVLPDEGSFSPEWIPHHTSGVLELVLLAGQDKKHFERLSAMLASGGMGHYGWGISDNVSEAVLWALDPYSFGHSCDDCGEEGLWTSNRAIALVYGHPDMVEDLRGDVESELCQSLAVLGGNWPFWRGDPELIVMANPVQWFSSANRHYHLEILSMGLKKLQPSAATAEAIERWAHGPYRLWPSS